MPGGAEHYSCAGLTVISRGPDCLRTLLRRIVTAGMSGPAKIVDAAGRPRMDVRAIRTGRQAAPLGR